MRSSYVGTTLMHIMEIHPSNSTSTCKLTAGMYTRYDVKPLFTYYYSGEQSACLESFCAIRVNPLPAKLFDLNFNPLEVVSR